MALTLDLLGLLGINLEDSNDDVLTGGNLIDTLSGGDGNDVIEGKGGVDVLSGGDGLDTLSYQTSPSAVNVSLVPGLLGLISLSNGGDATGDLVSLGFENVVGSAFADTITGDATANTLAGLAGDDTIFGGAGNDLLIGGAGADRMDGGTGIDTANYVESNAGVTVNLTSETGVGGDAQDDTLINIENVIGSRFKDLLIGSAAVNILSGGNGDDTLVGGAGGDTLDGGIGSDTASYSNSTAAVSVNLSTGINTGGHASGDVLVAIENLTGSIFDDKLTGDGNANTLNGYNGNDVINGAGGNDTIVGGAGVDAIDGGSGIDTIYYSNSTAAVTVNLATNINTGGEASGDSIVNVENVAGSAFNDVITGDSQANQLGGLAGNDILNGNEGDDYLVGGAGADVLNGGAGTGDTASYEKSSAAVAVDLSTGTGIGGDAQGDTLSGIEKLIGSHFADTLTGDASNNQLRGGDGNDVLSGGAGNDDLRSGLGADTLNGGAGTDTAYYYESNAGVQVNLTTGQGIGGHAQGDILIDVENLGGSNFSDVLIGDANANALRGYNGDDSLRGGGGRDTLVGDAGADRFIYAAVSDSTGATADRIVDFATNQGDKIDLAAVDANSGVAGDQTFNFIGNSAFSHVAGELRYEISGGNTTIQADVNGDGVADLTIHADGSINFAATDFVL